MKSKKTKIGLIIVLGIFAILLYLIYSGTFSTKLPVDLPNKSIEEPFEILISNPELLRVPKEVYEDDNLLQKDGDDERLEIQVTILNSTNQDFENGWFELELNSEVEPFVASKILKYSSDRYYITTPEKAVIVEPIDENHLKSSGFDHTWNMLLTTSEDLKEYHNKEPEEIVGALKSITVRIYWDGGSQTEMFPLKLESYLED